jgi:4-hydroxy-tetrahydrodipicolinate reductase
MGKEIETILLERGHKVVLIIDVDNAQDLNGPNFKEKKVDVAIEFSTPDTVFGNIMACLEAGAAVVCGTTGWLDRMEQVKEQCARGGGAFFYASNYSVGVNILFNINERLAQLMDPFESYDVTVEEVHHVHKKDAPSGTAITIAEGILKNLRRKSEWVGQTTTEPQQLEVLAVRRSVAPVTHTVTYESDVDSLTLIHNSKSRRGLAMGAVLAAEFLCGKKGVYSMKDMLGF